MNSTLVVTAAWWCSPSTIRAVLHTIAQTTLLPGRGEAATRFALEVQLLFSMSHEEPKNSTHTRLDQLHGYYVYAAP
jgi:hypothetical protein